MDPGVLGFKRTCPGTALQVAYSGRFGHENSTVPVQPLSELKVRVTVPGDLAEAVMVLLDAETVNEEGSLGREPVIVELASQ